MVNSSFPSLFFLESVYLVSLKATTTPTPHLATEKTQIQFNE